MVDLVRVQAVITARKELPLEERTVQALEQIEITLHRMANTLDKIQANTHRAPTLGSSFARPNER